MVPPEASCTLQYARSRQRARYGGIALTRPGLFAISAFALLLVCAGGAQAAERFDFPDVGPYQVLRCDFHMHTIISDGRLTGRERVEEAKKLGYDVIAITDHGQLLAYRSAKYVGDQIGVLVIRGLESGVRSKEHYVVLGIDSAYKPRDSHRWAESKGEETVFYQEQMAEVARRGGLIIWAHPHVGFRDPSLWGMKQGIIQGIELKNDVVGEGWNTKKSHGSNWYRLSAGICVWPPSVTGAKNNSGRSNSPATISASGSTFFKVGVPQFSDRSRSVCKIASVFVLRSGKSRSITFHTMSRSILR